MTRTDALKNSEAANAETTSANSNNTAKSHGAAASLHLIASESHKLAGDDELAQKHATLAADHTAAASRCAAAASNKVGAQPAAAALVGDVAAKDAAGKDGVEAGGPGSGPHKVGDLTKAAYAAQFTDANEKAKTLGADAYEATEKANAAKSFPSKHMDAAKAHVTASIAHENAASLAQKAGENGWAKEHSDSAKEHMEVAREHFQSAPDSLKSSESTKVYSLKAAARMAANAALCASVAAGGWSLNDLQTNVREAIADVDVLNEPAAEGNKCVGAWVCDIVAPVDDDDDWTAIVNGCNGKLYAVDFDVDDDGSVELDGDPQEVERSTDYDYVNDIMAACAKEAAGLEAGGPGSGPHKSSFDNSKSAYLASAKAAITNKYDDHIAAADAHQKSAEEHSLISQENGEKQSVNNPETETIGEHARIASAHKLESLRSLQLAGKALKNPDWAKNTETYYKSQQAADLHNAGAGGVGGKSAGGKDGLQATSTQQGTTAKSPNVDLDRVCALADMATEAAGQSTDTAASNPNPTTHQEAADAHSTAYDAHKKAYQAHMVDGAQDDELQHHMMQMQEHMGLAAHHKAQSEEFQSRAANQDAHNALNASIRDSIQAGDYPGHPFRGNQYGEGSSGGMAGRASAKAHDATKSATDRDSHKTAAAAHMKAAKLQAAKGNAYTAEYHNLMAAYHTDAAKESAATNRTTAQSATSAAVKQTGAAVKSDTKADHQAARMAHKKAQAANSGNTEGDSAKAAKHKEMAEHHHHMSMGRIPGTIGGRDHKKKKDVKAMDKSGKTGIQAGGPGSGRHAGAFKQQVAESANVAKQASTEADKASTAAEGSSDTAVHDAAEDAHNKAYWANKTAAGMADEALDKNAAAAFTNKANFHSAAAAHHLATVNMLRTTEASKAASAIPQPAALAAKAAAPGPNATNPAAASMAADQSSKDADQASTVAEEAGTQAAHETAAEAHDKAHTAHMTAYAAHTKAGSDDTILDKHMAAMADHKEQQNNHAAAALDACNASNGTPDKALKAGDEDDEIDESSAAYQEGQNADEGDSNPYDASSEDGQDWQAGYDSAHDLDASGKRATAALEASAHAALECFDANSNFKTFATEEGVIMYMPAGVQTITPSQAGRPVTVTLDVDAGSAAAAERQRKALTAKGKKPFFSIQHASEVAGFWPEQFFWDTRVDATGKAASGVWAKGTWSASGKAARDGRDFRTFSPTFFVDAVKNDVDSPAKVVCNVEARANMGALENDPAFQGMSPLWAKNAAAGNKQPAVLKAAVAACHKTMTGFSDTFTLADMASALNRNGFNVTEDDVAKNLV